MENTSNRTVAIAIVAAVVALLLGLCAGAAVGGVAGYALGQANRARVGTGSFLQPQITPALPLQPGGGLSNGVTVQSVVSGSPADQAGLQAGDVVTQVDNVVLDGNNTLACIIAQHKPGDRVRLTVERGGTSNTVNVLLGAAPNNPGRAYLGISYTSPSPAAATPTP